MTLVGVEATDNLIPILPLLLLPVVFLASVGDSTFDADAVAFAAAAATAALML